MPSISKAEYDRLKELDQQESALSKLYTTLFRKHLELSDENEELQRKYDDMETSYKQDLIDHILEQRDYHAQIAALKAHLDQLGKWHANLVLGNGNPFRLPLRVGGVVDLDEDELSAVRSGADTLESIQEKRAAKTHFRNVVVSTLAGKVIPGAENPKGESDVVEIPTCLKPLDALDYQTRRMFGYAVARELKLLPAPQEEEIV